MRINKKGQFYLIAAILIIFVVIGFYAYKNYASTEKNTKIYDLGKELELETGSVYDYGVYKQQETSNLIDDWAERYANYSEGKEVEEWIFIYGNSEDLNGIALVTESIGDVGIIGVTKKDILRDDTISIDKKDITYDSATNTVKVILNDFTHEFELKEGENFFFVLRAEGYTSS